MGSGRTYGGNFPVNVPSQYSGIMDRSISQIPQTAYSRYPALTALQNVSSNIANTPIGGLSLNQFPAALQQRAQTALPNLPMDTQFSNLFNFSPLSSKQGTGTPTGYPSPMAYNQAMNALPARPMPNLTANIMPAIKPMQPSPVVSPTSPIGTAQPRVPTQTTPQYNTQPTGFTPPQYTTRSVDRSY